MFKLLLVEANELNYKDMLEQEFELRCKRNSSYSLRAYARDLGLSVASLSKVMAGKQGLSLEKAKFITTTLELSELEKELFCNSVESNHARAKARREVAKNKLREQPESINALALEHFKIISDWHHFAILELTEIKNFRSDYQWIANRLAISEADVREAVSRLIRLGLMTKDSKGNLKDTSGYLATPSGIPNRSVRNQQQQLLRKSEAALFEQPLEERDFSAVTFAMNSADLAWAREELKNFRRKLVRRLSQREDKDRLYQLNMQLFALDQKNTGEKNEK